MSAAGGHWTPGAQRRRRLWSALLGAILLVAGFHRRPADREAAEIPELTKGRAPGRTARKARRAWIEIARLLYSAIGQHRVVFIAAGSPRNVRLLLRSCLFADQLGAVTNHGN